MTIAPVRIGLVGYGRGGRHFHAPFIEDSADCALAGVVTRSAERRAELVRDRPSIPAHDSLADLAAAGVDAVVISTPADTHEKLVSEAIERQLPIVCDKPFMLDAATARAVVASAERADVPLTVYQNRRWDADLLTVRKLLDSGELGEVTMFESRMEQYPPAAGTSFTGGGVLRDFGSHLVDQALVLFGPVRSVYADVHAPPDQGGFDDRFFVALHHHCGVTTHLWGDWSLQGAPGPRFRILGSAGTYAVNSDDGRGDPLLSGRTPATEGDAWGTVPEALWGTTYRRGVGEPVPAEGCAWPSFYTTFAAALRGEGPVPVNPWDAVTALEVLDAARISAAQGQGHRTRRAAGGRRRPQNRRPGPLIT